MNKLYIHLGPPKTATTSFQHFFLKEKIDNLSYEGIIQPRISDDNSLCKLLYNKTSSKLNSKNLISILKNSIEKHNVILSEEMFLVEQKRISWENKLKNLYSIIGDFEPTLLIVVRNPIDAIKSYYQELFYNLDKKSITSINDFALSDYCKIYDYSYLFETLKNIGFTNMKILKYEKLVNGNYSLDEIFDVSTKDKLELGHQNKSIKRNGKYYAKNNNLKNRIIEKTPNFLRNKFSKSIKNKIINLIPDFELIRRKEIDINIKNEITEKFLKEYKLILKSKNLVE